MALSRLDSRAGELGVKLGLEPVNRYESYMVNTLDQGADLIRTAGGRNLFLHMDTFHMNIEEADIAAAIQRNAARWDSFFCRVTGSVWTISTALSRTCSAPSRGRAKR